MQTVKRHYPRARIATCISGQSKVPTIPVNIQMGDWRRLPFPSQAPLLASVIDLGEGDDYAGLTQDGAATINGGTTEEDYIQNIGAGRATLNGGKVETTASSAIPQQTRITRWQQGNDDIDGPAAIDR